MQEQNPQKENIINLNLIVSVSEIGWNAWWVLQFGPLSQGPTCRAGLFFFFFSLSVIAFFFIFPFLRPTIPFLLHQEGFKYPKDDALFKAEVVRFQIALAFKSEWT